jgi:hypothetical protein
MNNMIADVLKMVALALPIVLAFGFAMVQLFKQQPTDESDDCVEQSESLHRVLSALALLVEVLIGGQEPQMACMRPSHAAWALFFLFLLFAIVLLLNMLIAAM